MRRSFCITLYLAATATVAVTLPAQTVLHGPKPVIAKPFSIVTEEKTVQTFADGLQVTRTTRGGYFRDSNGRMLTRIERLPDAGGGATVTVILQDLTVNETTSWNAGPHLPREYNVTKVALPTTGTVLPPAQQTPAELRPTVKHENLGDEFVEGFPCQASRTTTTYPVSSVGNDRPFTAMNESCFSREFGRALKTFSDDPRYGTTTLTVVSISRGEPDPSLFQPPANFARRVNASTVVPAEAGAAK